jgi:glucokinase
MEHNKAYLLAGDIGGTKTHLGLYAAGPDGPLDYARETYASSEVAGLEEMIAHLLQHHPVQVTAACFGIAGPVTGGAARLTNLSWDVSVNALRQRFQWQHIQLINDLAATALAVPWLSPEELFTLNRTPGDQAGSMALIAPGTGLGQALLLRQNGRYLPVASEGGHADFAPTDEAEIQLWRYLHRRYGHVSLERVLSGPGLVNIYEWMVSDRPADAAATVREALKTMKGVDPAQIITRQALDGTNGLCREALAQFCRILGAVSGNLALTGLATGGVYLGGGIPPKILPVLEKSDFMNRFCAKGRFSDLLMTIPVWVIRNDKAALTGAARRAFELYHLEGVNHGAGKTR